MYLYNITSPKLSRTLYIRYASYGCQNFFRKFGLNPPEAANYTGTVLSSWFAVFPCFMQVCLSQAFNSMCIFF